MTCISCSMVCKIFFCSETLIFWKRCGEEEDGESWQMQSSLLSHQQTQMCFDTVYAVLAPKKNAQIIFLQHF